MFTIQLQTHVSYQLSYIGGGGIQETAKLPDIVLKQRFYISLMRILQRMNLLECKQATILKSVFHLKIKTKILTINTILIYK